MALVFGAGGSGSAISLDLLKGRPPPDRPTRISVVDIDPKRLAFIREDVLLKVGWPGSSTAGARCHFCARRNTSAPPAAYT